MEQSVVGLLGVLINGIKGLLDFKGNQSARQEEREKDLHGIRAELYTIQRDYIHFVRSGQTDDTQHKEIILKAKSVCFRAVRYVEKCPEECLDVPTEHYADYSLFARVNEDCKHYLEYITRKRLTENQPSEKDNSLEFRVWGPYDQRNIEAFEDAIRILDDMIRQ